ncbi:MAG: PIN domain nuclease, partial [Chloroflexota bacterium]
NFINLSYDRYEVINIDRAVMLKACKLRPKYMFSYFDSLIVAAALLTDSTILYSEDMQHSLIVENQLTITNPFIGI